MGSWDLEKQFPPLDVTVPEPLQGLSADETLQPGFSSKGTQKRVVVVGGLFSIQGTGRYQ